MTACYSRYRTAFLGSSMPSSTGQVIAVPLRLVCARFYLFYSEADRENLICAVSSCRGALKKDNFQKAYNLICYTGMEDAQRSDDSEKLRQLALWLLCPNHKDGVGDTIAHLWKKESPDDDILHLLGLEPIDFEEWKCPEKGCDEDDLDGCIRDTNTWCKALTIMETLTPSTIMRERLSDKKRARLVTELVGFLHCHKHRASKNIKRQSDKWNNILTNTIRRRESGDSSSKEITRPNSSAGSRVSSQELDDKWPPLLSSEGRARGPQSEKAVPTQPSTSSASVQAKEDAIFEKANRNVEPGQIDMKLLSYIRSNKANTGKKPVPSLGDVYVLQNPEWPNHVKIGQTYGDPEKRITVIKKLCKIECLEQVVDTERRDFRNYELVEKLCHKELKNFKKELLCKSCKTKKGEQQTHHEWFQVKPEVAVRTVQKWRKWMSLSPYDENGRLGPWWREKPGEGLVGERLPNVQKETIDDHDSRHQRWSRWLEKPTARERTMFEIWIYFCDVRPERKSLWNTAERNLGPLLIYVIFVWFICEPRMWILVVLSLVLVLRDWA